MPESLSQSTPPGKSLRLQVVTFTITRIILNSAYRMVYPFLPAIGRGLGVDLAALTNALTWRNLIGAFGPFLATVSESRGRRDGMLFGLLLFVSGAFVVVFWPSFFGFILAIVLTTLGKFAFDPAMQAYLGDRVPYAQRGRTLAVTELAWSLTSILGLPLIGLLIARAGWLAPFPTLGVLGLLFFLLLFLQLPRDRPADGAGANFFKNLGLVFSSGSALAGLGVIAFVSAAHEIVNLLFGVWMEDSFGLQIAALGAAAAVIGFAELGGEGLVGAFSDRLGKQRAVGLGLGFVALSALALPLLGRTLIGALIGLFFFYIAFEFTFVSVIPIMTEILPQARATLLALDFAVASLGRALAAPLAAPLYAVGFQASAFAALLFTLLAFLALRRIRLSKETIDVV